MCAKSAISITRNFADFKTNHPRMTREQIALMEYFEDCIHAMKEIVPLRPLNSFGAVYFGPIVSGTFPDFSVRCNSQGMILEMHGEDVLVFDSDYPSKNIHPKETAKKMFLRLGN